MKVLIIKSVFTLLLLLLKVPYLYSAAGTSRTEFLLIGVGSRPTGMGEAYTAVADDVNTISYNPAGLGQIKTTQVILMYNKWIESIGYEYMGLAYHINENIGTVGLELKYLHMDDIVGRSLNGKRTEDFTASNLALTVSYGKKVLDNLMLGLNFKILKENIEDEESNGFAIDIGGLYKKDKFGIGVSIQNFGTDMKFIEDSEPLPLNIKVGVSYRFLDERLLMAADYNSPRFGSPGFNIGSEYALIDIINIRAGYKIQADLEKNARLNLGFGIGHNDYGFDYTYTPFGDIGNSHRFSLSLKFSSKKK